MSKDIREKIEQLYKLGADFGNPKYPDEVWLAYRDLQNALLNLEREIENV